MTNILEIKDLTIVLNNKTTFKEFSLSIPEKSFISIVASPRSGKSLLTKVIAGIIPTIDKVKVSNISLNPKNVLTYISKIGIVTNDFNQEFLFPKVKEELSYPLHNLGYSLPKIDKKIKELAHFFEIEPLLNKKISSLRESDKKKLLILTAIIHEPKILVLDEAFLEIDKKEKDFILLKLKELVKRGLTVLNITSDISTIYLSDSILIMNKFKILEEVKVEELIEDYDYLSKLNLKIPFIIELGNRLKHYKLISKVYLSPKELRGALWK